MRSHKWIVVASLCSGLLVAACSKPSTGPARSEEKAKFIGSEKTLISGNKKKPMPKD
jgi:hypothetical protein